MAVIRPQEKTEVTINPNDVTKKYTRSGGKGGQHRNKVETCVVLTHHPTGIVIKSDKGRKQGHNEKEAWKRLKEKLQEIEDGKHSDNSRASRSAHSGSERSDKVRTYRVKEDIVIDHRTGKSVKLKHIMRGRIEKLK